jgi:tripartite-type tricarboxylate transporter receptor subunit TctC
MPRQADAPNDCDDCGEQVKGSPKTWVVCPVCSVSSLAYAQTASAGAAQAWPSRPIRVIAPYPPGGGTGLNARMIAPCIATALGQQVIVENRPGAGAMLGTELVAKSPPDGYTMVIATIGPVAINPSLYSKVP